MSKSFFQIPKDIRVPKPGDVLEVYKTVSYGPDNFYLYVYDVETENILPIKKYAVKNQTNILLVCKKVSYGFVVLFGERLCYMDYSYYANLHTHAVRELYSIRHLAHSVYSYK